MEYVTAEAPKGGKWAVPSDGVPVYETPGRDTFASICNRCGRRGKHRAFQSPYAEHPSHYLSPTPVCDQCWPLVFPTGVRIMSDDE